MDAIMVQSTAGKSQHHSAWLEDVVDEIFDRFDCQGT